MGEVIKNYLFIIPCEENLTSKLSIQLQSYFLSGLRVHNYYSIFFLDKL